MTLFILLTELVLYTSFSVLVGSLILFLVPKDERPPLDISEKILYLATGLVPLAALLPVINTAQILSGDMGFWFIFRSILFTFEIGKAWLFIVIVSVILLCALAAENLKTDKKATVLALTLTVLMLLGYTKSSHAASITEWQGFLFHTLHFLAVTVWIGLLFTVSWFSKNKDNWSSFLKWFTPVAIMCLIVAFITGYFTMGIDINSYDDPHASILQEYKNSLLVNYGQALLLKHVFIISLVLFAVINGFLFRKKQNHASFHPLKWARLESFYALVVFGITAFMGQSWPPHQVYSLVQSSGPSPLFDALYDGDMVNAIASDEVREDFDIMFSFGLESYVLFGLSLLFMGIAIFVAAKKQSAFVSVCSSLFMALAIYFGIVIGVQ